MHKEFAPVSGRCDWLTLKAQFQRVAGVTKAARRSSPKLGQKLPKLLLFSSKSNLQSFSIIKPEYPRVDETMCVPSILFAHSMLPSPVKSMKSLFF